MRRQGISQVQAIALHKADASDIDYLLNAFAKVHCGVVNCPGHEMLAHFCGSSIQWWLTVGALSFAKRLGFFGCAVCVFVLCAYGMESVRGCPLCFLPDSELIGTPKAPFLLHVWPSKSLQHISGRTLIVGRFRDHHNTPSETRVEGTPSNPACTLPIID